MVLGVGFGFGVIVVGLVVLLVMGIYCGVKKVCILVRLWVWWKGGSEFRKIWL